MTGKALVFEKERSTYLTIYWCHYFAVFLISLLMVMFRSFKMVVVSLIPNLLPLMITAGLMGYFDSAKTIHYISFSIAFDFQSMTLSISWHNTVRVNSK
jgi:predicted RND superfamily exporter protein